MQPRYAKEILKSADGYAAQGMYDEAFGEYQMVTQSTDNNSVDVSYAYNGMGNIYYKLWQLPGSNDSNAVKAKEFYELAIQTNKDNSSAFYNIGCIHYAFNQINFAIEYIYRAHEMNPTSASIADKLKIILEAHSPEDLFQEIMGLPFDTRCYLLKKCLNSDTLLGERFDEDDSVLNKIYDYLESAKPNYVTVFGMFLDVKKYDRNNSMLNNAYDNDKRFAL